MKIDRIEIDSNDGQCFTVNRSTFNAIQLNAHASIPYIRYKQHYIFRPSITTNMVSTINIVAQ